MVSSAGLNAATAVSVGFADERVISVFPASYALTDQETRQYQVRQQTDDGVVDLAADPGTSYIISDPSVVSIDANGLLAALSAGMTEVTVVNGGRSFVTTMTITTPQASGSQVGDAGGVVVGDGIEVGIPAGAYAEPVTVNVREVPLGDFPYAPPEGWAGTFGLSIETDGIDADQPLSVAIPAPDGSAPGDPIYLFQPVDVPLEGGGVDSSWMLIDSMMVGDDGLARTTSLPNIGIKNRRLAGRGGISAKPTLGGALMAASPGSLLGLIAGQHDLDTRAQTYTNFNARSSVTIVQMDATGDLGGNDAFYVFPGLDFDFLVPAIPRFDYTMSFLSAQPNGLSLISSNQVQVAPGETAGFIAPIKPRTVNTTVTAPIDHPRRGHLRREWWSNRSTFGDHRKRLHFRESLSRRRGPR